MPKIILVTQEGEELEIPLEEWEVKILLTYCKAKRITLQECIEGTVRDFMGSHPIIKQTRTIQ